MRTAPSLRSISKRSVRQHNARDRRRGVFFGYYHLPPRLVTRQRQDGRFPLVLAKLIAAHREQSRRWAAFVPEKHPSAWALKHVEQPALLISAKREECRRRADAAVCGLLSNFGCVG
jgi:hypothetical protein